ncbi:MAG TPA: hypothetical protein VF930_04765 [Stellaceae bacterium]
MADASAAFLRGRAEVYRRKATTTPGSPAVAEYLRLAELWEAEAVAAEAEQAKQPAQSILRKPAAPSPVLSIRNLPPSGLVLKSA